MIKHLLLLIFLATTSIITLAQQSISGTFSPTEKYNFGMIFMIDVDNVFYHLDSEIKDGKFSAKTKEDMLPGMYRLVYNLPQDENFFDFIYSGKEAIEFTYSNIEGVQFTASKENQLWYGFKNTIDAIERDILQHYQAKPIPKAKITALFEMLSTTKASFKKEAIETLAATFINGYAPYVPRQFETENSYQKNRKEQYFNTVDFSSSLFQKTALPLEMIIKYVFAFSDGKNPEASYKINIDTIASKITSESDLYQKSLLDNLWQFLVNNDQVSTANHLATEHLIAIATRTNDDAMVERLNLFKSLSIGSSAPDFSWEKDIDGKTETKWLQDLDDAENYIIIFWSSTCSHCLAEIPKIHEQLKGHAKGTYKVIAIGLENETYDWENAILELPNFTHVLGLGKWENKIGNSYDVSGTPTYFVLDSDKKIAQKPESFKLLMDFLALDK